MLYMYIMRIWYIRGSMVISISVLLEVLPVLLLCLIYRIRYRWQLHVIYMYIRTRSRMMTSWNGNIFRVAGHLCGKFTGPRWIPHKGQWRGTLMFSLICVWISSWVNSREAGDLRRHRTHYGVIVMQRFFPLLRPSFLLKIDTECRCAMYDSFACHILLSLAHLYNFHLSYYQCTGYRSIQSKKGITHLNYSNVLPIIKSSRVTRGLVVFGSFPPLRQFCQHFSIFVEKPWS